MDPLKSEFLREMSWRGYIHQCTDTAALDDKAAKGIVTAYIGFDCTAPSLHIGNLIPIMMLRRLQQTGHRPIVLMGAGTSKIGDPSGKDETRTLLTPAQINQNMETIKQVFANFLQFGDGPTDAIMANNADWLDNLEYVSFLRDIGPHFSINRMLTFDSVRLRLEREQTLSFLEFNYMILQAYDFLELSRRYDCALQMGGSDQWGNIVNGVELTRRIDSRPLFGLTTPLITTASGQKMGKTHAGAVWLNADQLSPYDYWQFWRNTEDADVPRFLRLFTDLPAAEIDRLANLQGAELNEAKKLLASEATRMAHGAAAATTAEETAKTTFEQGGHADGLPQIGLSRQEIDAGINVYSLLVRAGFAASNGAARRLIKGGGARINDQAVDDEMRLLQIADMDPNGVIKLSAGKKRHILLTVD